MPAHHKAGAMTNPIEPARKPVAEHQPLLFAAGSVGALRRRISPIMAWARLTKGSLRFGGPDGAVALDTQTRGLLWHILIDTISAIGVLGAAEGSLEAGLAALDSLAERARIELAANPPRGMALPGAEPPQVFVIEILQHDLQPCLGRWRVRLEAWHATGWRAADWPLRDCCRGDLIRTRERLLERAWQLGVALSLPGIERLLPERPAVAPELASPAELAAAEALAVAPIEPAALIAGWQIYIEAATRIPAPDIPNGPGVLGEAIAALDLLANAIRAGLKAMPPAVPGAGTDTIQALSLRLLNEGVAPFLVEWRPRYHRFAASERPEAKWGRAEACRAALTATIARCQPTIYALGGKVGAPLLPEPKDPAISAEDGVPLQLPAPLIR